MKEIFVLVDYKGFIELKYFSRPYRSGMEKELLIKYFGMHGYKLNYMHLNQINNNLFDLAGKNVIYNSSEDVGYFYKSYIEDVVYSLEISNVNVIPSYKFLKAHNNKAFMELLSQSLQCQTNVKSIVLGSLRDYLKVSNQVSFPCVYKTPGGAAGVGVFLAKTHSDLISIIKRKGFVFRLKEIIKDQLRPFIHKGYVTEDMYRKKFIIQEFIPNLKNDWKLLIYGNKIYVFNRPIQKGRGIRASGGGYDNYFYGREAEAPEGMFDFAYDFFLKLNMPQLSVDIAFNGEKYFIIEYQAIHFGTGGIPYSNGYYQKNEGNWVFIEKKLDIEQVYAESIVWYLEK